jgi:methyl-accepting chemotaxis protein
MNSWRDLKVSTKLTLLITVCCLSMLVVGGVGILGMGRLNTHIDEGNDNMRQVALLGQMKGDFLAMRLSLVYMLSSKDTALLRTKLTDLTAKAGAVREALKQYQGFGLSAAEKEKISVFSAGFEEYVSKGTPLGESLIAARERGDEATVESTGAAIVQGVAPLYTKPAEAVAALVESQLQENVASYQQDKDDYRRDVLVMAIIILTAIGLSLLLGMFISRGISRPLEKVLDTLGKLAGGDLTAHLESESRDEMGLLSREVNGLTDKLRNIIATVAQTAVQVSSASYELRNTSGQIANGADEVASQANTLSTSSEEMAATSSDIARNCLNAADNSRHASATANAGAEVVQQTINGMAQIAQRVKQAALTVEELGARSDQIGAIIGTIEDIADQTNLLALNAAIEAARAGEQGRGFAVVADEVRALAERTTRATREIGDMIKSIQSETRGAVAAMEEGVSEVEKGTASSKKSGEALQGILQQINEVTMQVHQIATAAEEQTATTGEITGNIQEISDVVQLTARGAAETATAAADLSRQAEDLQRLVAQFTLS